MIAARSWWSAPAAGIAERPTHEAALARLQPNRTRCTAVFCLDTCSTTQEIQWQ
jgi:hypothetical protein